MTQPKPITVLKRAKTLLENRWGKGSCYDPVKETYCAIGALNAVTSRSKNPIVAASGYRNTYAYTLLKRFLEPSVYNRTDSYSVAAFNDRTDTTKEDILTVYDEAIKLAQNEG